MLKSLLCAGIVVSAELIFASSVAAQTTSASLDKRWADLASPDEGKAARAMLALAATPKETGALLKERLKPVKADAKQIAQMVARLNNSNFSTRNQAMQELEYYGKYIKSDLEKALKNQPEVETKVRIEQLLAKMPKEKKEMPMPKIGAGSSISVSNINSQIQIVIDGVPLDLSKAAAPAPPPPGPPLQWQRAVRAITILEHFGTPEARQLLQTLADGEADALPTTAARAALERLKKEE